MKRIVCLGDSLTSGHGIGSAVAFPALLHQRVRRAGFPYEVLNAGRLARDFRERARPASIARSKATCASW